MQTKKLLSALSQSTEINTTLGLNYFNQNITLYIKILNSFVSRYQNLNIHEMEEEERKRTLHSLKGLSATLGMEQLSNLISQLEYSSTPLLIKQFNYKLESTIEKIIKIKI